MTVAALLRRLSRYDLDVQYRCRKWSGETRWFVRVYDFTTKGDSCTVAQVAARSLYAALRGCVRQIRGRK